MSPSPKNVETKSAGVRAWIRDTVRARGPAGALRYYVVGGMELLRDLAPSRRRSRYGDIDYDFDHGVDTTWATIPLRTRVREWLSGGQYQPSEPALFHQILHSLPVAPDSFTFIDLGSGKGRTLLMASDYPFRRIVGIELLNELDIVARQTSAGTTVSSRSASCSNPTPAMRANSSFLTSRLCFTCSIRFPNLFWPRCSPTYATRWLNLRARSSSSITTSCASACWPRRLPGCIPSIARHSSPSTVLR